MYFFSYLFLGSGLIFVALAGVGLLRMPTLFMRLQATSKASTLGVILMVIGLAVLHPSWEVAIKGSLICVFLLVSAPVAAHAIALEATERGQDQ